MGGVNILRVLLIVSVRIVVSMGNLAVLLGRPALIGTVREHGPFVGDRRARPHPTPTGRAATAVSKTRPAAAAGGVAHPVEALGPGDTLQEVAVAPGGPRRLVVVRRMLSAQFVRFGAIGALGTVVNLGVLWLLVTATPTNYVVAAIIAAEVSILHNFALQERLVFHDARARTLGVRLWRSLVVNNLELLVRTPALIGLVELLRLPPVPAQAILLLLAFIARFAVTKHFVYGGVAEAAPPPDLFDVTTPPSDEDKYDYLRGRQHRWIFVTSALAFTGVAASMGSLAFRSIWTNVLLVPLILIAIEQALGVRTATYRRRVDEDGHRARVAGWAPGRVPSVDVFLPTCGEAAEVLRNTYTYVAALRYPGTLSVHVLDDADRYEVRELAQEFGFAYLARPGSTFKKAGNLQYAFERTGADQIVIFDADFVPRADFLTELLPYMDDPDVGIVQSPQYFETTRRQHWLQRAAGATQELFFRFIQPSRDAAGGAICVGTSAVYRRAALEATGGFPLVDHSEDVFTGIAIGRLGWQVRYVPVIVSRGVCPDSLDAFATQQYRWCEGSMALVADHHFHADESMSIRQRMSYWAGFLYYATTAMAAVLAPIPLLIMLFAFGSSIRAWFVVPLVASFAFWLVVMPLVSRTRWRYEVVRAQAIYGVAHLLCIADMVRGAVAEWIPTGATNSRTGSSVATRVRWFIVGYFGLTQVATVVGLLVASAQVGLESVWPNIVLFGLQAYVLVPVMVEAAIGLRMRSLVRRPTYVVARGGNR